MHLFVFTCMRMCPVDFVPLKSPDGAHLFLLLDKFLLSFLPLLRSGNAYRMSDTWLSQDYTVNKYNASFALKELTVHQSQIEIYKGLTVHAPLSACPCIHLSVPTQSVLQLGKHSVTLLLDRSEKMSWDSWLQTLLQGVGGLSPVPVPSPWLPAVSIIPASAFPLVLV